MIQTLAPVYTDIKFGPKGAKIWSKRITNSVEFGHRDREFGHRDKNSVRNSVALNFEFGQFYWKFDPLVDFDRI